MAKIEGEEVSEATPSRTRSSLRIMQWNADGLRSKALELQSRLHKDNIDVCLVQETKLLKRSSTPSMKGYTPYRSDRTNILGGGLIAYVKKDLDFQKIGLRNKSSTPSNSLICSDFNGHSQMWDQLQPLDPRGGEIEDWIIDKELGILNGETPTRLNKNTGNWSTPDLTLCGTAWSGRHNWAVLDDIGGSDHMPILITLQTKVNYQPVLGRRPRWKSKGVDWSAFTKAVDESVQKFTPTESMKHQQCRFAEALINAAKSHVGKVKPGARTKVWMNPAIRTAIRKRNGLRRDIKNKRREWL